MFNTNSKKDAADKDLLLEQTEVNIEFSIEKDH
jgi:hypothetical protein